MTIVNQTVPRALRRLGYDARPDRRDRRLHRRAQVDPGRPAPAPPSTSPVFACSMGDNAIHYSGHVKMMGAVQPFISGAISKTVNMPEEVTVEEVEQLHIDAWRLGIKAVAIYRDNCKVAQPLSTAKKDGDDAPSPGRSEAEATAASSAPGSPSSRRPCPSSPRQIVLPAGARAPAPHAASRAPSSSGWPTARASSPSASTTTAAPARSS